MTTEQAKRVIQDDAESFNGWVTAVGVLISSSDSTLDDLLLCLHRKGLPAEMAATALYVRTGRIRESDSIESFVVDHVDWSDYVRKQMAK